jgi:succinate dehydrogenase/fumarate reductase flavoprotein subunit
MGVWLDTPMIDILRGSGAIERELPAMLIQFDRYEMDIRKEPLLVYPTLHYQNGGVCVNERMETSMEGLFCAGEASGGLHGDNRLMGNSLQDVLTFGRRAGTQAAEYVKSGVKRKSLTLEHVVRFEEELKGSGIDESIVAPMVLPDYTTAEVKGRQWTAHYEGTLR